MARFKCLIEEIEIHKGKECFRVKICDTGKIYFSPILGSSKEDFLIGKEYTFFWKSNYHATDKTLKLEKDPMNLPIVGFGTFLDKKQVEQPGIIVSYKGIDYTVKRFTWQQSKQWNKKALKCSVDVSGSGTVYVRNRDYEHPIFEINKTYSFKIHSFKSKLQYDENIDVLKLIGPDDCFYDVKLFPGQKQFITGQSDIECKVLDILHYVRLSRSSDRDRFFQEPSAIIKNADLVKKHINPLINAKGELKRDERRFVDQYRKGSAFWVLTLTNKVFKLKIDEALGRHDYVTAIELNSMSIELQKWMLEKGLIGSIQESHLRERSLKQGQHILTKQTSLHLILNLINKNQIRCIEVFESLQPRSVMNLYFLLGSCDQNLIEDQELFNLIQNWIDSNEFKNDMYNTHLLQRLFSKLKWKFIAESKARSFNLTSKKLSSSERKSLYRHHNWAYFEYLMANQQSNHTHCNILASQIIKGLSEVESSFFDRLQLLKLAYHILEHNEVKHTNLLRFDKSVKPSEIDFDSVYGLNLDSTDWLEIEKSKRQQTPLRVRLVNKSKSGFEVNFNGLKGFLPSHKIIDNELRNFGLNACDITTSVTCVSCDSTFKYFIAEHIPRENPDHFLVNNYQLALKIGEVLEATVKSIEVYGMFVITQAGEGLLYKKDIFNHDWDYNQMPDFFRVGQTLRVTIKEIKENGQIGFSLKQLQIAEPSYYANLLDSVLRKSEDQIILEEEEEEDSDSLANIIQKEKGLCFEQLALFQTEIDQKINSFRLAKQLYANTNSARSYLINIFTDYFEILLKLKECLDRRDISDLEQIISGSQEVEARIDEKTILKFPDSEKLLQFIQILGHFNNKSQESIIALNELIVKFAADNKTQTLRTIAKISLSNNLLVSEVDDNDEIVLRNLNFIYQYLASGILSLAETSEDRFRLEMKQKIDYLRSLIDSDENQSLEFKSTLFVPLLNEKNAKELEILQGKSKTEAIHKKIDRINGKLAKKIVIHSAMKNICAFANTLGGKLLIGVNDEKEIIGIKHEFKSLADKGKKNKDGYGLFFDALIKKYFGEAVSSLLNREFIEFPEGLVLMVDVTPSKHEVFMLKNELDENVEDLYIRNLSSADKLTGIQLAKFIKDRHNLSTVINPEISNLKPQQQN